MREVTQEERVALDLLYGKIIAHQRRNKLRTEYAEWEHVVDRLGFSIPPQMTSFAMVLGWCRKACDVLGSRLSGEGFTMPNRTTLLDDLDDVFGDPRTRLVEHAAKNAAIRHGVSFVFTSAGDTSRGESEVLTVAKSALAASADVDPRSGVTRSALELLGGTKVNLYLPGVVHTCVRRPGGWWVEESYETGTARVLCSPFVHSATLEKPLGESRITPAMMKVTDGAVRTLLRQEVSAEFYSAPRQTLLGADESVFMDADGNMRPGWESILGAVWAIPDDEDEMTGERHRVDVSTLPQMSMQPFSDVYRVLAGVMSGESGIPPHYLGVLQDSNPTSADAIHATEQDLVRQAKDQQLSLGMGRASLARDVLTVIHGDLSDAAARELRGLSPRWADPRTRSVVEQSQFVAQQVGAGNFAPGVESTLSLLPISQEDVKRISEENRRSSGAGMVADLLNATSGTPATIDGAPVVDEVEQANAMRAKLEALGVGVRAGATFESLVEVLGLQGLVDSGAVPVSLRIPEREARELEDSSPNGAG